MRDLHTYHLYHIYPMPLAKDTIRDQHWLINNQLSYALVASITAPSSQEAVQAAQQQARGERPPRGTVVRTGALLRVTHPGDVLVAERQSWMVQTDGQLRSIAAPAGATWKGLESTSSVSSLAWSPDGQILAAAESDNRVTLHDLTSTSRYPNKYTRGQYASSVVAWSPDGSRLASGGYHGEVHLWQPAPGRTDGYRGSILVCCPPETRLKRPAITSLTWSPDGSRLLAGRKDGQVVCWQTHTAASLPALAAHQQAVTAVAFSPHHTNRLLTASEDGSVRIWDQEQACQVNYHHETGVTAAVWSPDGTLAASCARHDETLHLWDARTGEPGMRIPLSLSSTKPLEVLQLAWSPDGKWLAAGCDDSTVQVIDLAHCQHIHTYRVSTQVHRRVNALAWSPNGEMLAAGNDGYHADVLIWQVKPDLEQQTLSADLSLAAVVEEAASAELSHVV